MALTLDEFDDPICPFCKHPLREPDDYIFKYYVCNGNCDDVYFDGNGDLITDYDDFFDNE